MWAVKFNPESGVITAVVPMEQGSEGDIYIAFEIPESDYNKYLVVGDSLMIAGDVESRGDTFDDNASAGDTDADGEGEVIPSIVPSEGLNNNGSKPNDGTIILGDGDSNAETGGGNTTPNESNSDLSKISNDGVLVAINMHRDSWVLRDNYYVYGIAAPYITPSTYIIVLGVNREALKENLFWIASAGRITFSTSRIPTGDVVINGVLMESNDDWSAQGRIDCLPGSGLSSERYNHRLYFPEFNLGLAPGDTVAIETPLDFAAADLLFATPEWTGNSHVIIPQCYVNSGTDKFCFRVTNLSSEAVRLTDIYIRILYKGNVAGLIKDVNDTSAFSSSRYITNSDIDVAVGGGA